MSVLNQGFPKLPFFQTSPRQLGKPRVSKPSVSVRHPFLRASGAFCSHCPHVGEECTPCPKCTCDRHTVIFLPFAITPRPHPDVSTPHGKARDMLGAVAFQTPVLGDHGSQMSSSPGRATSSHIRHLPAPALTPGTWGGGHRDPQSSISKSPPLQKKVSTSSRITLAKPPHKALFMKRHLPPPKKSSILKSQDSNSHKNRKR